MNHSTIYHFLGYLLFTHCCQNQDDHTASVLTAPRLNPYSPHSTLLPPPQFSPRKCRNAQVVQVHRQSYVHQPLIRIMHLSAIRNPTPIANTSHSSSSLPYPSIPQNIPSPLTSPLTSQKHHWPPSTSKIGNASSVNVAHDPTTQIFDDPKKSKEKTPNPATATRRLKNDARDRPSWRPRSDPQSAVKPSCSEPSTQHV